MKRHHRKLSIELKEILLHLDEEQSFEQTKPTFRGIWRLSHRNKIQQNPKKSWREESVRMKIATEPAVSMNSRGRSCRQTARREKPAFQLAKVSIGRPEVPYRLRSIRSTVSPCSRNRIKIVVKKCQTQESRLREKMRKGKSWNQ